MKVSPLHKRAARHTFPDVSPMDKSVQHSSTFQYNKAICHTTHTGHQCKIMNGGYPSFSGRLTLSSERQQLADNCLSMLPLKSEAYHTILSMIYPICLLDSMSSCAFAASTTGNSIPFMRLFIMKPATRSRLCRTTRSKFLHRSPRVSERRVHRQGRTTTLPECGLSRHCSPC